MSGLKFVGVACEMVFVFENKLRGHTIERAKTPLMRKTDMILEEIVKVVLGNAILDDMSTARKPLSLEDLRALMLEAAGHPALKIGPESMGQVFSVSCMAMKANLLRIGSVRDIVTVMNDKLNLLQRLFTNPHMREDISRVRSAMSIFYGSLSDGALSRVRSSQINVLRGIVVPVSTLINEGLQLETGHIVPKKTGPNTSKLGSHFSFAADGTKSEFPRIQLADVDSCMLEAGGRPVIGENIFERGREMELEGQQMRQDLGRFGDDEEQGTTLSQVHLDDRFTSVSPPSRSTSACNMSS